MGIAQREVARVSHFEIKDGQIAAMDAGRIARDDFRGPVLPPAAEVLGGFEAEDPIFAVRDANDLKGALVHGLAGKGSDYHIHIAHLEPGGEAVVDGLTVAHGGAVDEFASLRAFT